ncbi:MAG: DUF2254 family protein [Candidatus Methanoperedens sp.]
MKINESYMPLLKNWLYGIAFYFIPFVVGYLAFRLILSDNVLHTDVDSARYMLSALVQSEAAIVALVVTLSLVAVQLAAQSYSARVIEVFRRTPDLWILMGIYGIAIFYGLGVLKMIEKANPQVNSMSNLEGHIAFSYYLGVFAFVALVPYIWKILDMLKPSTVINMLAERITRQSILSAIKEEEKAIKGELKVDQTDTIQPIIDIVRGALIRYDYETVRDGLRAIGNRADNIFENETFERDEEEKISRLIFGHFTRVGKLAAIKQDEYSTVEVIYNLHIIGITVAKRKLHFATYGIIKSLRDVGIVAAERKLEWPTTGAVDFLGMVGKTAAEYNLNSDAKQAVVSLRLIGSIANKHKFEDTKPWIDDMWIEYAIKKINEALSKSQQE